MLLVSLILGVFTVPDK